MRTTITMRRVWSYGYTMIWLSRLLIVSHAISNHNHNNNHNHNLNNSHNQNPDLNSNPNPNPSLQDYNSVVNQHHLSMDPNEQIWKVDGETEAMAFYHHTQNHQDHENHKQDFHCHIIDHTDTSNGNSNTNSNSNSGTCANDMIASSTSIAMFCQGGGSITTTPREYIHDHEGKEHEHEDRMDGTAKTETDTNTAPFVAMAECAFVPYSSPQQQQQQQYLQQQQQQQQQQYLQQQWLMEYDMDMDMDSEDEDDDEEDDDGHSSMLSNTSLRRHRQRRSLASANGASSSPSSSNYDYSKSYNKSHQLSSSSASVIPQSYTHSIIHKKTHINHKYAQYSKHSNKINPNHNTMLNKTLILRGGALSSSSSSLNNEFTKRLIVAALVTLLYEGAIGHILEFLKIVMQTAPVGTTYTSILQSITQQKGIMGAWDGFVPWGVLQAIGKGGVFGLAHTMSLAYLDKLQSTYSLTLPAQLVQTLAGGIAGGFQGYVLSPILLLKTRVMTNEIFRTNLSLMQTVFLSFTIGLDVVRSEGILALLKGSNVFALKRVLDWSTRYYFSDRFEALFRNILFTTDGGVVPTLTPGYRIAASLLGGTASTLVTLPLDVIVAKAQDAKKAGVKVSAWDTFRKDYEENGWKGLYDANMMGFEARLAHVCFTTVVIKTGSPIMYDFLFGGTK